MKHRKIRCKNCGNYFYPDKYNYIHQKYCSRNECRKASRRASSKNYRQKKSNNLSFRQTESARVKVWQSKHRVHIKNSKKSCKKDVAKPELRDFAQVEKLKKEVVHLRDFANLQSIVLQGVISQLTGCGLRDDIGAFIRRIYDKGRDISGTESGINLLTQNLLNERHNNETQKNDCTGEKT
jgi:hypothetical protein